LALLPPRSRSIPRPPSTPAIAVGQRVFVHSPNGRQGLVSLSDQDGKDLRAAVRLADGLEVEVVAWRPRVAGDAHYRVRAPSNGADGWLSAVNLRSGSVPLLPPERPATQATPVTDPGERRFGQRSHTRQPPASGTPATGGSPLASDDGRRGFGQHFDPETTPASPTPKPASPDAGGRRRFGQHS
jgi:hypothetical protein